MNGWMGGQMENADGWIDGKCIPQCSSSELSEQSEVKSHTWLRLTHSLVALHTNWPGGQLWGGVTDTVGTGAVVLGSSEGNLPAKCISLWKSRNATWRKQHIYINAYGRQFYLKGRGMHSSTFSWIWTYDVAVSAYTT